MLFNSATYLILFLPVVCLLYWLLPYRPRIILILLSSAIFYGFWRVEFVPLMFFSALIDYYLALAISKSEDPVFRKRLLITSIVANLSILGFFKYLIFFRDSLWSVAEMVGYQPTYTELYIILPLGISFYIFQTISYTIDVYRKEFKPEKDILTYLSFVTFFPQLVAGPILRAHDLIPQLHKRPDFDFSHIRKGIEIILAGLFLKVVLADTIAGFVDEGFVRDLSILGGLDVWTLAFLFGFQIYFDFGGYSLIAIGSARLLGIKIPQNFNYPYLSHSPREFWQRWHISLSGWIRDYLYLPIVGAYRSRATEGHLIEKKKTSSPFRKTWGLFLTWGIMGLWHGANWTFVIWGLYHALLVLGYRLLVPRVYFPSGLLGWGLSLAITLPLMMAAWIPFRAQSVADTFLLWRKMLDPSTYMSLGLSPNSYIIAAAVLIAMFVRWFTSEIASSWFKDGGVVKLTALTSYYAVIIGMVFIFLQVKTQFIYFQF